LELIGKTIGKVAEYQRLLGYWRWNPVRMVLEYDAGENTHRYVTQEEGEGLLDADSYKMVWGEKKRVYRVRTILNGLNRQGLKDTDIAEKMGVGKSTVSQWDKPASP
jgi:hypothetical protein